MDAPLPPCWAVAGAPSTGDAPGWGWVPPDVPTLQPAGWGSQGTPMGGHAWSCSLQMLGTAASHCGLAAAAPQVLKHPHVLTRDGGLYFPVSLLKIKKELLACLLLNHFLSQ